MQNDELDSYLDAQRFYFLAEQCLNIIQKSLGTTLKRHGLTHTQHLILLVLRYAVFSGQEVISTDIASLLGLEKHSITAVVDKLVERKLVVRERSQSDRRAVHLGLTPEGQELAARVQAGTRADISVVPDDAESEFAHLCDFLQTLRAHIAASSGQPGQAYDRAYQNLLMSGQAAYRHHLEQSGTDSRPDDDSRSR
jgi:DNA-binding MarR family transcriptional regulator